MIGDEMEVGFGNFDVVAESAVVADFEIFDVGILLFGFFEFCDPGFVVGCEGF